MSIGSKNKGCMMKIIFKPYVKMGRYGYNVAVLRAVIVRFFLTTLAVTLTACGGGGGDAPPANNNPVAADRPLTTLFPAQPPLVRRWSAM